MNAVAIDDYSSGSAIATYLQPLQRLLAGEITEVVVNRPGEAWTEGREGWQRHDMPELSYDHLRMLAKLIATSTHQTISENAPVVSAALPGGERVQAIVPPAVPQGTVSLTIRKPSQLRLTLADYERGGAFERVVLGNDVNEALESQLHEHLRAGRIRAFLELAVQHRQNIVVSGATGSGKTTIMKTLVDLIPVNERLITIEDTPELEIRNQPNHVRLFYSKDGQGVSNATPKLLLESCLRMKPDRIMLAELRSEEAFYFIRNVNSGHPGSITSVHATSPRLAIEQLMLLVKESPGGAHLSREDIKQLLFMLVDIVIQFSVVNGRRCVTGIYYEPERKRSILA
ncbi:P-type DNA transfer ATPase VirB11 [Dyella sp. GSA-30]|uniref:P-type DNA transfer ATPase VirB11 n=1 Tax=Dyella sp. GSA-30 TaxID=2994496 RepID=UPI002490029E|nr:P-type DNA transfer ATPase VirB11 [Dyella sp. GSA-30]BDU18569.1 P-type DNA transfer ATPase VirB11 [Dyella sp. GSA-30]